MACYLVNIVPVLEQRNMPGGVMKKYTRNIVLSVLISALAATSMLLLSSAFSADEKTKKMDGRPCSRRSASSATSPRNSRSRPATEKGGCSRSAGCSAGPVKSPTTNSRSLPTTWRRSSGVASCFYLHHVTIEISARRTDRRTRYDGPPVPKSVAAFRYSIFSLLRSDILSSSVRSSISFWSVQGLSLPNRTRSFVDSETICNERCVGHLRERHRGFGCRRSRIFPGYPPGPTAATPPHGSLRSPAPETGQRWSGRVSTSAWVFPGKAMS